MPLSRSYDECRHCGKPIVLEPYWQDGRGEPNEPVWVHPIEGTATGTRTCSTTPKTWAGYSWPVATPVKGN